MKQILKIGICGALFLGSAFPHLLVATTASNLIYTSHEHMAEPKLSIHHQNITIAVGQSLQLYTINPIAKDYNTRS